MAAGGVDFIAVSFVRAPADIARSARSSPNTPHLVAKIETLPAVALEEIAGEADAIMVARGDLGIECPLEDVPHLQKRIVRHCVEMGVPVITATQMMESMITSPSPTRAEVSDIANAVFDGTDALMLSAETAIGHDPARWWPRCAASPSGPRWRRATSSGGSGSGRIHATTGLAGPTGSRWRSPTLPGWPPSTPGADAILCCTRPAGRRGRWRGSGPSRS